MATQKRRTRNRRPVPVIPPELLSRWRFIPRVVTQMDSLDEVRVVVERETGGTYVVDVKRGRGAHPGRALAYPLGMVFTNFVKATAPTFEDAMRQLERLEQERVSAANGCAAPIFDNAAARTGPSISAEAQRTALDCLRGNLDQLALQVRTMEQGAAPVAQGWARVLRPYLDGALLALEDATAIEARKQPHHQNQEQTP